MGSEFKALEVGYDIIKFKFPTEFQMRWVLENGPWSFENNFLLLRKWELGCNNRNMSFTMATFWIQIWGLPFEFVSKQTRVDIGNSIGSFVVSDKVSSEQTKYLPVRVDILVDKPLCWGGFVSSLKGEKVWVDYRYERLPNYCYRCGRLGHEEKGCNKP